VCIHVGMTKVEKYRDQKLVTHTHTHINLSTYVPIFKFSESLPLSLSLWCDTVTDNRVRVLW
jgi:hypothetical protein